ncbi:MAG: hypothetical protein R2748_34435 [Bryobacterales bacterium]
MADFHELVDFFKESGAAGVDHTEGTYLGHCAGVYRDMKRWGFSEELAQAGLFHSIYGTGIFQKFGLDLARRDEVRAMIGDHAENVAYLFCAMDYDTFDENLDRDAPPYSMIDRFTGERIEMTPQQFEDVVRVQLVDWLEQLPRGKRWDRRREAYRKMAERIGPKAVAEYERVYALEAAPV